MSDHIYEKIVELSDLGLQRKLWLNESNDTGLISSYIELMNSLFDDFSFDHFIDKASVENKLSAPLVLELHKLRDLLNSYQRKRPMNR